MRMVQDPMFFLSCFATLRENKNIASKTLKIRHDRVPGKSE
jgi:hypothetical protein